MSPPFLSGPPAVLRSSSPSTALRGAALWGLGGSLLCSEGLGPPSCRRGCCGDSAQPRQSHCLLGNGETSAEPHPRLCEKRMSRTPDYGAGSSNKTQKGLGKSAPCTPSPGAVSVVQRGLGKALLPVLGSTRPADQHPRVDDFSGVGGSPLSLLVGVQGGSASRPGQSRCPRPWVTCHIA